MKNVYTERVVPDELLELWHHTTPDGKFQTISEEDETTMKHKWEAFLLEKLLHVDNHPTLTRFFSFRCSVDKMLTLSLLDVPATGGLQTKSSAREVGQKRLKRVSHWFGKKVSSQALRRSSLVLQLTSFVEAFMSRNPKEGEPPILVSIHQKKAHEELRRLLRHLLTVMHQDPDLNLEAATGALFATAIDLIARLDQYLKFPYKFVTMCRRWFPNSCRIAIGDFLAAPAADLDVGFTLELRNLALAQIGERRQYEFMLSEVVQEFLEGSAIAFCSHSLAAERLAAQVKRRESRTILLLGNVSLDVQMRRFAAARISKAKEIDAAAEKLKKLKRSSWQSVCWQRPGMAPRGVPWTAAGASSVRRQNSLLAEGGSAGDPRRTPEKIGAVALAASSPATGVKTKPRRRSSRRIAVTAVPSRDRSRSPAYQTMKEECKVERKRQIEEATAHLDALRTPTSIIPCTRVQWKSWLALNAGEFRKRMQRSEAYERRRAINIRVGNRLGLPAPAPRLQPQAPGHLAKTDWGKLLAWRTGWHCLETADPDRRWRVCFVALHLSQTYVLNLEKSRVGKHYHIKADYNIMDSMMYLDEFELLFADENVRGVYNVEFEHRGSSAATGTKVSLGVGGVVLRPARIKKIETPAPYRRKNGI